MSVKKITSIQIGIINANRSAKIGDQYIDDVGVIWVGTISGGLIVPLTADQIPVNDNGLTLKQRLTELELPIIVDVFTPTAGQNIFVLSKIPTDAFPPVIVINSAQQLPASDYSISSKTLSWVSNDFSLAPTDKLVVRYSY
jgi:hypothetical protein